MSVTSSISVPSLYVEKTHTLVLSIVPIQSMVIVSGGWGEVCVLYDCVNRVNVLTVLRVLCKLICNTTQRVFETLR